MEIRKMSLAEIEVFLAPSETLWDFDTTFTDIDFTMTDDNAM